MGFADLAEDPESFSSVFFVPAEPEEPQNEDSGHGQHIRYEHATQARHPKLELGRAKLLLHQSVILVQHEGRGRKLRTGCRSYPRGGRSLTMPD